MCVITQKLLRRFLSFSTEGHAGSPSTSGEHTLFEISEDSKSLNLEEDNNNKNQTFLSMNLRNDILKYVLPGPTLDTSQSRKGRGVSV